MSKHTPGPWSAFIHRRSKTVAIDIGPTPSGKTPTIVAWMGFDGCDLPFTKRVANARLIAAAPDLLDSLRELLAYWDEAQTLSATSVEQARAAIAKAEGQS